MTIHTVKPGDTVFKIARMHGTSPMKIVEDNGLTNPDRLTVGEELLISLLLFAIYDTSSDYFVDNVL